MGLRTRKKKPSDKLIISRARDRRRQLPSKTNLYTRQTESEGVEDVSRSVKKGPYVDAKLWPASRS